MAGKSVYELLEEARQKLASVTEKLKMAQGRIYDTYLAAVMTGLIQRYDSETAPARIVQEAERIVFAMRRARELYVAGLSPNEPPVAAEKPKEKVP